MFKCLWKAWILVRWASIQVVLTAKLWVSFWIIFFLKISSKCFCGDTYGKYGEAKSGCDKSCTGDKSQSCGGLSSNNIWKTCTCIFQQIFHHGLQLQFYLFELAVPLGKETQKSERSMFCSLWLGGRLSDTFLIDV